MIIIVIIILKNKKNNDNFDNNDNNDNMNTNYNNYNNKNNNDRIGDVGDRLGSVLAGEDVASTICIISVLVGTTYARLSYIYTRVDCILGLHRFGWRNNHPCNPVFGQVVRLV